MNGSIGLARHGKRAPRMSPQEIANYRRSTPAIPTPTLQPHIEPESPYDIRGNVKPQSRAWMSGKTIWFTLFRIAKPGHVMEGQWIPITRTMRSTPERRKMVRRVLKAREDLAQEMLKAAHTEAVRPVEFLCSDCGAPAAHTLDNRNYCNRHWWELMETYTPFERDRLLDRAEFQLVRGEADFRLIDRVDAALAVGQAAELLAEEAHFEEQKRKAIESGLPTLALLKREMGA